MIGPRNGVSSYLESLVILRNEPPEKRLRQSAFYSNTVVKDAVAGGSTMSAVLFSDSTVFTLTQVPHFPAINRRFYRFGVGKALILLMLNPGFSMLSHKKGKINFRLPKRFRLR